MKKGIGLTCALSGVWEAVRRERNMRIHLTAVFWVTAYGWIGQVERWAWCAILLCFGAVLTAEAFNGALERLCDQVTTEQRPLIRKAKDMAAGGVLLSALASVLVAVVVFARPMVWHSIAENPLSWQILPALPLFGGLIYFDILRKP